MQIRKLTDKKPKILIFQGSPRKVNSCANQIPKSQIVAEYILEKWIPFANFEFIDLVNEVQRFTNGQLGARDVYKVYYDFLPKKKTFDKYIKKSGGNVVSEEIISYICKYFEVSSREADDYLEILSEDEVRSIIKKYGVKDSQIDKMYKDAAK